jgi:hypothetical protein
VVAVADWEPRFSVCENLASRTLIERFSASKTDTAAMEFSVVVSMGMFTLLNSGSLYVPHYRLGAVPGGAAVPTHLVAENSPCRLHSANTRGVATLERRLTTSWRKNAFSKKSALRAGRWS